ncbi:MAG: TonB-dependent receptor [Gammaproteobacteria bacterium]|nr:MAG: TonB-dependent receptor [Gammaproteobacteria bacterium]TLY98206.1 MAG: TonB-dependent receptor [Gammaproteobacteria bacterium]TLZ41008.1 MAG: TonB-dependent receptor [Gammaproteobacteria bacterium]
MARTRAGFIRILTISTVAAFAGLPFVASAQQPDQGIQEIIVTATKREANLQDVPFSVSATSQDQIRNSGAMDLVDLARNIAGFAVADLGPGQSQVAIRGISSGQVIRDQPGVKEQVGVYLDESPISVALFTPDLELYDLDRFEVLRGPQGTLFGAGSESGTVRYITHQPQLGKTEVSLDASLETVSHGDEGGYLRAALNLPVTDVVAARLVGYWHHLPGFVDAITPIGPIGANSPSGFNVQKSINDGDRSGVRLAFLVKPSADLSITPRIMFQKLETNGYPRTDLYNILGNSYTATQPPVSIGSLQQYRQQHDGMIDDFTLADLKVDYDTGPGTLTSITSFTHRNVLVARDATQLTGSVTFDVFGNVFTPNNPAGVRTNSPLFDRTHLNVLSQEVRLASNGKQMIDWLVGGFFQHVGRRYGQNLPTPGYDALNASFGFWPGCPTPPGPPCSFPLGNDTLGPADTPFFSDLSYRLKQYAAFGEGTWHATDQIAVTAGLRYYKFNEDRVLNFHGGFAAGTPAGGVPGSTDSNGVSPRLILSYKPVGDVELSAQAARGFRLGGINDPLNIPLCSPVDLVVFGSQKNWKDEKTWNYELGAKTQWMDRRVTFNISAFYADIKDLQATTTAGTCSSRIVFNVPTARSTGVEAELFARPNANWDFGISATVIDAKLTSSVTSTIPPPTGSPPGTPSTVVVVGGLADGNRLPTAPKTQAVGSVGYTVPVKSGTDVFANATVQYVGSSFSQFENEQTGWGQIGGSGDPNAARLITYGGPLTVSVINFNPELPSYTLANFRLGLKTNRWQLAAYITNISDKNARLALDYERGRSARVGYLTNQPRTIGVYGSYVF